MEAMLGKIIKRFHSQQSPTYPPSLQILQCVTKKLRLNYARIGKGPALILIHGWTNNWEGWLPLVPFLQKSFTLYILDLPGFGDSCDLPTYTIGHCSYVVKCFVDEMKIRPLAVVGVSMGSFVTADFAHQYPSATQTSILIGPVIKNNTFIGKAVKKTLQKIDGSEFSESVLKKIIETRICAYLVSKYINMYEFKRELVDLYGMTGKKKMRKKAYVQMGVSASDYPMSHTVASLTIPTLLVYGREDKINSPLYAKKEILPFNKHVSIAVIPFAGHVVQWEKPEEVARAIKQFLSQAKRPIK